MDLGTRMVIGNGQQTHIWEDRWIPYLSNFRVCSPVSDLELNAKVRELIDTDTKQWNSEHVFQIFNAYEAQMIVNIPISIWHWGKDGKYSVRSVYHLLCEEKYKHGPESSSSKNKGLWKAIWTTHIPNCIRNFLWRLARNILPTRINLGMKGIKLEMSCPLCNMEEETLEHLFMHCPVIGLPLPLDSSPSSNCYQLMDSALAHLLRPIGSTTV